MVLNGKYDGVPFTFNNDILEVVTSYKYLGVTLSSKYITNFFKNHFSSILERARSRAALISRYGFHQDGLRLESAIRLYKLVVRPILEYCAQVITHARYSESFQPDKIPGFAKDLEHFQTQTLKRLINCPRSTSPAVVRLFCGVEPLTCRFEFLKVRYFWKLLHGSTDTVAHKFLIHRKRNLLDYTKGFAREVFNICCKYDAIHIWNGIVKGNLNPLRSIKKIIISANLRKDLETGRTRICSFANIFLSNAFRYQKTYHIVEPLRQIGYFKSPDARKRFFKALLHPCSYPEECSLCGQKHKDMLGHFLSTCSRISELRKTLNLKLALYNYPKDHLP